MTLGEIIKQYRNDHSLSMDAFSELSGLSKSYIAILEKNQHPKTGKPVIPSITVIRQAADGMHMDFNDLIKKIDGDVRISSEPVSASTICIQVSPIEEKVILAYRSSPPVIQNVVHDVLHVSGEDTQDSGLSSDAV